MHLIFELRLAIDLKRILEMAVFIISIMDKNFV